MSNRILLGTEPESNKPLACFFCGTTDIAYGPVFRGDDFDGPGEEAAAFERWLEQSPFRIAADTTPISSDPRHYPIGRLLDRYREFRREVEAEQREGART